MLILDLHKLFPSYSFSMRFFRWASIFILNSDMIPSVLSCIDHLLYVAVDIPVRNIMVGDIVVISPQVCR